MVNSASSAVGNLAPGELVTVYGTDLGPATPIGLALDSSGKVATSSGGVEVLVNGTPAPLLYVSSTQIDCVVPYEVASAATAIVEVLYPIPSNGYLAPVATVAPGIFTLSGSGNGPGAILNSTGGVNGPGNPAAGSTITIFLTGGGQTNPSGVTGAVTAVNSSSIGPLTPQPLSPPTVTIGGVTAQVSFYGEAPGPVFGVTQINAIVPSGLSSGSLPLVVSSGAVNTQSGVTVSGR